MQLAGIGLSTMRLGQDHWRAKITDHDVDLIRVMLRDRRSLVASLRCTGKSQGEIDRWLRETGLSFRCIAVKFEVSKSLVRAIGQHRVRLAPGCSNGESRRVGLQS